MGRPSKPTFGDLIDFTQLKANIVRKQAEIADAEKRQAAAEEVKRVASVQAKRREEEEKTRLAEIAEAGRRRQLYEYLKDRGVIGLTHFTRESNLESILKNGLLPRSMLDQSKCQYAVNDSLSRLLKNHPFLSFVASA